MISLLEVGIFPIKRSPNSIVGVNRNRRGVIAKVPDLSSDEKIKTSAEIHRRLTPHPNNDIDDLGFKKFRG
ncbi:MAG: hypothetical protein WC188_03760 [Candidatus Caldatribacteriota bacterium]|jgi:hypothetical protein